MRFVVSKSASGSDGTREWLSGGGGDARGDFVATYFAEILDGIPYFKIREALLSKTLLHFTSMSSQRVGEDLGDKSGWRGGHCPTPHVVGPVQ